MSFLHYHAYKLGYDAYYTDEGTKNEAVPRWIETRDLVISKMHVAKMPCPASCGEACPNHFCPSHNGKTYIRKT